MKENIFERSKYPTFSKDNPGSGLLKIQVFTANQAFPIKDVKIKITKDIDGENVIFYEGVTNDSGIIDDISLPTKKAKENIESFEDIIYTTYVVSAEYPKTNTTQQYNVSVFDDLKVIQPIRFSSVSEGDSNE